MKPAVRLPGTETAALAMFVWGWSPRKPALSEVEGSGARRTTIQESL